MTIGKGSEMSEKELKVLSDLISEYELRAKYNDDQRDYVTYHVLVKAYEILKERENV